MKFNLADLLAGLHDEIHDKLAAARKLMGHPVDRGDASEGVWLELLNLYLPARYKARSARSCDFGQVEERCGNKRKLIDGCTLGE